MRAHLPVVHDTVLACMNKFDRVFHRNDMVFSVSVGLIDNRGQRGGFARPGGTGYQHQSPGEIRQSGDHGRKTQLLCCGNIGGYFTKYRGNPIFLHEIIDPVTGHPGNFIPEVHISGLFKLLDFFLGSDFIEHGPKFVRCQGLILDPLDISIEPQGRLLSG